MSDQDVAMRIALASAFRDCGLPSDEQDVDDFLVALRSFGYVVERLDHRTRQRPASGEHREEGQ
jgi:hypothetical protein